MKLNIKKLRNQSKMSIRQLSKKSKVSSSYISELENKKYNNPTIDVVCKICAALNCSLNDLIDCDKGGKDE